MEFAGRYSLLIGLGRQRSTDDGRITTAVYSREKLTERTGGDIQRPQRNSEDAPVINIIRSNY